MNQHIQKQTRRKGVVVVVARTEGLGQVTRKNGVTITELETRITDILERMIVLEDAVKQYKEQTAK